MFVFCIKKPVKYFLNYFLVGASSYLFCIDSNGAAARKNIMAVRDRAAFVFAFVVFAAGAAEVEVDAHAVGAGLDHAGAVGAVVEGGVLAALGDGARHVERGVSHVAACAGGHVAVGVVFIAGEGGAAFLDAGDGVTACAVFAVEVVVRKVGLGCDVADGVVIVGLGCPA